jgi:chromosome segregation ATPase
MKAAWLSITSPKRKKARMSEDKTKEMNDSKSFEERVFERFERIEGRLISVEIKISKLEERQYDTRPIWEQVLAAIAEINTRLDKMDARLDKMDARLDKMDARLDKMDARLDKMDARLDKMDARFDKQDAVLDTGFRSMERKMDVLNKYFLETRADQRYLDDRLEKLESQAKPS